MTTDIIFKFLRIKIDWKARVQKRVQAWEKKLIAQNLQLDLKISTDK